MVAPFLVGPPLGGGLNDGLIAPGVHHRMTFNSIHSGTWLQGAACQSWACPSLDNDRGRARRHPEGAGVAAEGRFARSEVGPGGLQRRHMGAFVCVIRVDEGLCALAGRAEHSGRRVLGRPGSSHGKMDAVATLSGARKDA